MQGHSLKNTKCPMSYTVIHVPNTMNIELYFRTKAVVIRPYAVKYISRVSWTLRER